MGMGFSLNTPILLPIWMFDFFFFSFDSLEASYIENEFTEKRICIRIFRDKKKR